MPPGGVSGAIPEFASGALAMAYLVAALFFLRFWRDTRERIFGFFTAAFLMFAVQRTALTLLDRGNLLTFAAYGLRILGFLLIVAGVVAANWSSGRRDAPPDAG